MSKTKHEHTRTYGLLLTQQVNLRIQHQTNLNQKAMEESTSFLVMLGASLQTVAHTEEILYHPSTATRLF